MSDKASGREVALGKIGIVFTTREHRKVALVPAAFRERVSQLVDSPPRSTHNLK